MVESFESVELVESVESVELVALVESREALTRRREGGSADY